VPASSAFNGEAERERPVAMAEYSLREVIQLSGLSRHIVLRLAKEGIVAPERVRAREYRFSFQDLIVLRTARSLYAADIAPRRIALSLRRLRARLPESVPMCGLRVSALGADVVVHESTHKWDVSSGQLLLDFDLQPAGSTATLIERPTVRTDTAETHFETACRLEDDDPEEACASYRRALACDSAYLNASLNLGCLLHSLGRLEEAENVYRGALTACEEKGVLWFNLGVLHEDQSRMADALAAYRNALEHDAQLADAHYNSARLYSALGQPQEAVRAFNDYRRLQREAPG
jgi:tetratricopeptide (TPR) repeat protein